MIGRPTITHITTASVADTNGTEESSNSSGTPPSHQQYAPKLRDRVVATTVQESNPHATMIKDAPEMEKCSSAGSSEPSRSGSKKRVGIVTGSPTIGSSTSPMSNATSTGRTKRRVRTHSAPTPAPTLSSSTAAAVCQVLAEQQRHLQQRLGDHQGLSITIPVNTDVDAQDVQERQQQRQKSRSRHRSHVSLSAANLQLLGTRESNFGRDRVTASNDEDQRAPLSFFSLAPVKPLSIDTCQPLLLPPASLVAPTTGVAHQDDSEVTAKVLAKPGSREWTLDDDDDSSGQKKRIASDKASALASETVQDPCSTSVVMDSSTDEEHDTPDTGTDTTTMKRERAQARQSIRKWSFWGTVAVSGDERVTNDEEQQETATVTGSGASTPRRRVTLEGRNDSVVDSRRFTQSDGSHHGDPGDEDPETQLAMAILGMRSSSSRAFASASASAKKALWAIPMAKDRLAEDIVVGLGSEKQVITPVNAAAVKSTEAAAAAVPIKTTLAKAGRGGASRRTNGQATRGETLEEQEKRLCHAVRTSVHPLMGLLSDRLFFFDTLFTASAPAATSAGEIVSPSAPLTSRRSSMSASPRVASGDSVKQQLSPIRRKRDVVRRLSHSASSPSDLAVESARLRNRSEARAARRRARTLSAGGGGSSDPVRTTPLSSPLPSTSSGGARGSTFSKMFGMTSLSRRASVATTSSSGGGVASDVQPTMSISRISSWLSMPSLLSRSNSVASFSDEEEQHGSQTTEQQPSVDLVDDEDAHDGGHEADDEDNDSYYTDQPSVLSADADERNTGKLKKLQVTGLPIAGLPFAYAYTHHSGANVDDVEPASADFQTSQSWPLGVSPTYAFTRDADESDHLSSYGSAYYRFGSSANDAWGDVSPVPLPYYSVHRKPVAMHDFFAQGSAGTGGHGALRSPHTRNALVSAMTTTGSPSALDDFGVLGFEGSNVWDRHAALAAAKHTAGFAAKPFRKMIS